MTKKKFYDAFDMIEQLEMYCEMKRIQLSLGDIVDDDNYKYFVAMMDGRMSLFKLNNDFEHNIQAVKDGVELEYRNYDQIANSLRELKEKMS
jgi:hypothetical protein